MTGWRMGYGVLPEWLVPAFSRLVINSVSCTNAFAQYGAIEALTGSQDDADAYRAEFIARRSLMVDGLNAIPGVSCRMPHGAFYAFPNLTSFGRSSAELADHLLYDAGVCGLAGTAFGKHGEGYLRFSYANSRENLRARPPLERTGGRSRSARSSNAHGRARLADDRDVTDVGGRPMDRHDEPRVLVTRVIPDAGLDPVRDACEVDLWTDELPPPREELLRRVAGEDGLLSLLTDRVDDELLDAAGPQLKVVSNFAVGFDNIDVPALTRRKIPAGNTPGVLTETTADLAFALLMAAARRIPEGVDYVRDGSWRTWGPMLLMGVDIHGATLGIVGFGRIGREMARRGRGFGMRILYHDVHPGEPRGRGGARRPARRDGRALAGVGLRDPARQPDR